MIDRLPKPDAALPPAFEPFAQIAPAAEPAVPTAWTADSDSLRPLDKPPTRAGGPAAIRQTSATQALAVLAGGLTQAASTAVLRRSLGSAAGASGAASAAAWVMPAAVAAVAVAGTAAALWSRRGAGAEPFAPPETEAPRQEAPAVMRAPGPAPSPFVAPSASPAPRPEAAAPPAVDPPGRHAKALANEKLVSRAAVDADVRAHERRFRHAVDKTPVDRWADLQAPLRFATQAIDRRLEVLAECVKTAGKSPLKPGWRAEIEELRQRKASLEQAGAAPARSLAAYQYFRHPRSARHLLAALSMDPPALKVTAEGSDNRYTHRNGFLNVDRIELAPDLFRGDHVLQALTGAPTPPREGYALEMHDHNRPGQDTRPCHAKFFHERFSPRAQDRHAVEPRLYLDVREALDAASRKAATSGSRDP